MNMTIDLPAEPYEFALPPEHCALLIIDMQRDFLEPGGFGEMLGNDVSQLRRTIEPNQKLSGGLARQRLAGLPHPRRPPARSRRSAAGQENPGPQSRPRIGDAGPMGRILVRGEAGHDIIPELYPAARRAGDRQARQGRFLRHGPARDPAASRTSSSSSSPA